MTVPNIKFIWQKIATPAGDSGCWEWLAYRCGKGYGILRWHGKKYKAHRWTYEYFIGPIPEGLQIDHLCRNRGCVNPLHLEPVTPLENSRRGLGNHLRGKTHCPQGHPYNEENTYRHINTGYRSCWTCLRNRKEQYKQEGRYLKGSRK